ncbi:hypothetical protein LIER_14905 [Lithospermum erythrorhizon]|uniref:DUF4283 domain-containing protein n=1 Tax=Lithospermum erythrorhizon TaxID=34254 RepID=A0AAV3Q337_LITER
MASYAESNNRLINGIDRQGWINPMNNHQVQQTRASLAQTLIGHFIDDGFFTEVQLQTYVNTAWHLQQQVQVRKHGRIFLFSFRATDDMDLVMAECPLNMHGALMVLDY